MPTVAVIAGTRPECIKLASVIERLTTCRSFRVVVVNSGQHVAAVQRTFLEFGIRPTIELAALPSFSHLGAACSHLQTEIAAVLARERPAVVIVQGDTLTAYAGARAAHEAGLPLAHIEAGLRTDRVSEPFPEEWFRRRIARHAQLHFAPSRSGVENLLDEGVPVEAIHRVGNTGIDSLRWVLDKLRIDPRATDHTRDRVLITVHRRRTSIATQRRLRRVVRALGRASRPAHAVPDPSESAHRGHVPAPAVRPERVRADGTDGLRGVHRPGRACCIDHQRFRWHPGRSSASRHAAAGSRVNTERPARASRPVSCVSFASVPKASLRQHSICCPRLGDLRCAWMKCALWCRRRRERDRRSARSSIREARVCMTARHAARPATSPRARQALSFRSRALPAAMRRGSQAKRSAVAHCSVVARRQAAALRHERG